MSNTYIKYGNSHTATKILSTEANSTGGVYEVYVSLIHEYNNEIMAKTRATRTSSLHYQYVFSALLLRASGVNKIKWEYTIGSKTYIDYDVINIYVPYAISANFFNNYSYLNNAENVNKFDDVERKVRNIIHAYCGQEFQVYPEIDVTVDGNDTKWLPLPLKLNSFTEVISTYSDGFNNDVVNTETAYVEKAPESEWHLRRKGSANASFEDDRIYTISGDWGWLYVPDNVTQAAELLIAEQFNDDNAYRNHGVTDLYMDTHRMRIDDRMVFDSTGVIDADVLLMDYIRYEIMWV